MADRDEAGGVSTTRKSFEILELLRDADGATLAEIREATGLAKSTVYRHLKTLYDMKYVVDDDGEYRLSLKFLQLSEPPRIHEEGYLVAKQKVIELAQETRERALFLVEERFDGVYVHRAGGQNPLHSDTMIGVRRPLHALAAGKAILAEWPEERVDEYVRETGLPRLTDTTITDREALLTELSEIRERGFALNEGEHMEGLRSAGVSVHNEGNEPIGAFSVFGPTGRVTDEDLETTYPRLLQDKAQELKIDLTYD